MPFLLKSGGKKPKILLILGICGILTLISNYETADYEG